MKKKTFTVYANGMDFYCEMMGQGPTMVLVPPVDFTIGIWTPS